MEEEMVNIVAGWYKMGSGYCECTSRAARRVVVVRFIGFVGIVLHR